MSKATVIAVQLHEAHGRPLRSVSQARGLLDQGLEGDSHSLRGPGRRRQVLILDRSTLDHFGLRPGDLREQITISGWPDIERLPIGARLRVGDLTLEAAGPCEPCQHIGELLGVDDPEALRQALQQRRGLLCRVVDVQGEGWVRVGDGVELLANA